MKLCFLAPANSAHTRKWSGYFVDRGHEVHVVSFTHGVLPGVTVHCLDSGAESGSNDVKKLLYLLRATEIRRLIRQIDPDLISVHYATSYGTAAALAGLKNYVLSVWGSDIFEFPRKSFLHEALLKFSLKRAPHLFSTSKAMAAEAAKYTDKEFVITPFGVDMDLFSPDKRDRDDDAFVVGTVKGLSAVYGIDYLLRAAALVRHRHPEIPLHIRIAGKGPDEKKLKALADQLGISDITDWLGFITQEEAAREWANMDVAVVASTGDESFGVSAVEAQASGSALIVSDAPGLLEVTLPGDTAVVVPRRDVEALAKAIVELYAVPEIRGRMGRRGRDFVLSRFEYSLCFGYIEKQFVEISTQS